MTETAELSEQQAQVMAFMQENRIPELVENMTAQLVYHRPDDPRQFLINMLETLKKERDEDKREGGARLFDEANFKAAFAMLDVTGRGFISLEQYNTAMQNLGISKCNPAPDGYMESRISLETFLQECEIGTRKETAYYA